MLSLIAPSAKALLASQIDLTSPGHVEIKIDTDRNVVWVNVNGVCAMRINDIPKGCLHFLTTSALTGDLDYPTK